MVIRSNLKPAAVFLRPCMCRGSARLLWSSVSYSWHVSCAVCSRGIDTSKENAIDAMVVWNNSPLSGPVVVVLCSRCHRPLEKVTSRRMYCHACERGVTADGREEYGVPRWELKST